MPRGWITIASAAEILGVSVATLRNWDKSEKLKAHHQGNNKYRLYKISDLENFIAQKGHNRKKSRIRLNNEEGQKIAPRKKSKKVV